MTMSPRIHTAFALFVAISLIFKLYPVYAESQPTTLARWTGEANHVALVINVADLLTSAQREIVNSGFSTFTVLTINEGSARTDDGPISEIACSVKYDTWEDRYELIKLTPEPVITETVKDYKLWTDRCLEFATSDPKIYEQLERMGEISAVLRIRQSTPDEAGRIKNWLLRQQSGFMQGLYAHMLGDFELRHNTRIKVSIQPRPKDKRASR